jgi:hypothetical protein
MAINPAPQLVTEFREKIRNQGRPRQPGAFLFPAGKSINQLLLLSDGKTISIEGVFPFSQSHPPPHMVLLDLEDSREFGRRLVKPCSARTQMVVTANIRFTINVVANGYHLQFNDMNNAPELFSGHQQYLAGLPRRLRIADLIAPVASQLTGATLDVVSERLV